MIVKTSTYLKRIGLNLRTAINVLIKASTCFFNSHVFHPDKEGLPPTALLTGLPRDVVDLLLAQAGRQVGSGGQVGAELLGLVVLLVLHPHLQAGVLGGRPALRAVLFHWEGNTNIMLDVLV